MYINVILMKKKKTDHVWRCKYQSSEKEEKSNTQTGDGTKMYFFFIATVLKKEKEEEPCNLLFGKVLKR